MAVGDTAQGRPRRLRTARLEAFSDGVFAIAITLLVLERVAVTIYGITLLVAAVLTSVLWRYAVHERLVRPDAADEEVQTLTTRLTPGLAGYVVMILLGLFLPIVAVLGYLVIALYFIVPFQLIGRRLR